MTDTEKFKDEEDVEDTGLEEEKEHLAAPREALSERSHGEFLLMSA
jgi:hypothetical protein